MLMEAVSFGAESVQEEGCVMSAIQESTEEKRSCDPLSNEKAGMARIAREATFEGWLPAVGDAKLRRYHGHD